MDQVFSMIAGVEGKRNLHDSLAAKTPNVFIWVKEERPGDGLLNCQRAGRVQKAKNSKLPMHEIIPIWHIKLKRNILPAVDQRNRLPDTSVLTMSLQVSR
jgi:hypothetical protein